MDTRIIDGIANSSASVGEDRSCPDDDFVDRVNHTYTMNLLMFFTAIVLSRQLVGKPISCWIPNDFTGAQGEYAETVCWVTSTYFIPPAQATVPIEEDIRYEKKIYYYQWVPFILMIQAALFVLPCIVWRLFNTQSRINLRTVMEVSSDLKNLNDSLDQRRDLINCLVRHLEDALAIRHFRRQRRGKKTRATDQHHYGKGWSQLNTTGSKTDERSGMGRRRFSTPVVPLAFSKQARVPGPRPCMPTSSTYLSGLYLAIKVLYLANSTTQLILTGKLTLKRFLFLSLFDDTEDALPPTYCCGEPGHWRTDALPFPAGAHAPYPPALQFVLLRRSLEVDKDMFLFFLNCSDKHRSQCMGVKVCNPGNVWFVELPLCVMPRYLNGEAFIFGIDKLRDLMNTRFWNQTGSFPRVALCDFELRRMGSNQHRYTIQCVLRINIFNEKIYIFLWFWFFLISVLNLLSFLRWCYKLLLSSARVLFIRNLICIYFNIAAAKSQLPFKAPFEDEDKEKQQCQLSIADIFKTRDDLQASWVFSEDILGQDGVLLLRFINMNVGPSSAAELAGVIWIKYRKTAALVNGTTSSGVEDFVLTNIAANEIERPPAIPPKRRRLPMQGKKKKPTIMPLSAFIYRSRHIEDNDSDKSTDSSRPTIEMLQERRRYRPMSRKRGNYFSDDDDENDQMSVVHENYCPEDFLDNHDIPETEGGQDPEDLASEYRSFTTIR
ncbi:Innexin unc-7 [Echinococcus granulosus]|uniref:Innexin n=1 Tax=Echinococcus granulosus TaxID=6210 RepID=W6UM39_ECHGR|nr:Innexin unc-7 [Echinococcus granulosus]EUB62615.1 Innexin unc-7 [Echinococcus granulosus]